MTSLERPAKIISYLLHPVVVPLLGAIVLLNTDTYIAYSLTDHGKRIVYAIIGLSTCLLPIVAAILFLRNGLIGSLQMRTRQERRLPFLVTAIFYFTGYYMLNELPLPKMILLMQLGATLSVIVVLIINLRWKISVHMTGIGGFTGAILGIAFALEVDLSSWFMIGLLLSGLVGTARLVLKTHKPAQVYAGFALGFICLFLTLIAF